MTVVRPASILCPKWEPTAPGSKRCRYYIDPGTIQDEGMCKLPDEFLCVEWVRRNGTDEQRLILVPTPPTSPVGVRPPPDPDAPAPLVLAAQDSPPPRPPARLRTTNGEVQMAPPRPFEPAKEIDPSSLEALERVGVEVELSAPHLDGGITLVPKRTGRTDRSEITFREAATIRMIVDCFPGAHVTAYRSNGRVFTESLDRPFEEYPLSGTQCSVCGELQRSTVGGLSCVHGHGGAEPRTFKTPAEQAGVTEQAYAAEMAIGTGSKDDPTLEEDPLS